MMHREFGTRVHSVGRGINREDRRHKGGSSSPMVAPTYTDPVSGRSYNTPDELNTSIDNRELEAKNKSNQEKVDADTKAAQDLADWTAGVGTSRIDAEGAIRRYFASQGLDPQKYWDTSIAPALDAEQHSIKKLDPNPSAAFAPTLGASIINDLTTGGRNRASAAVDTAFPSTYAADALPYTLDDSAIANIITSQFDPLNAQVTNAQKRGTLNPTGYDAALKFMAGEKTKGESRLSALGTGIIDKDRGGINDYIGTVRDDVGHLNLNNLDSFSPDKYTTEAQGRVASYKDTLPGDLQNAVGSTPFTDLTSILNAGGAVQGAYDPTAANPSVGPGGTPSPQYIADQVLANTKRGIGNAGAF